MYTSNIMTPKYNPLALRTALREGILFIPKNGGLQQYLQTVSKSMGIDLPTGTMSLYDKEVGKFEVRKIRGEDVLDFTSECAIKGIPTISITGQDLNCNGVLGRIINSQPIRTKQIAQYPIIDINTQFGSSTLCAITKTGDYKQTPNCPRIIGNAKYNFLIEYYCDFTFETYNLDYLYGETEQAIDLGIADVVIEIVNRGNKSPNSATSKSNLKVVELIKRSSIVAIEGVLQ